MLYNCGCDSHTVDIPIKKFVVMSEYDLEIACNDTNGGWQIGNPFYNSFAETRGVILTPEEVELREEKEYEEVEEEDAELNIDSDYWED